MIEKINWGKIVNKLHNAKNRIVLIMPSVHEEWVDVIISNANKLQILICIDNSEVAIRNGYGSIKGIDGLKNCGADIRECDGLS